MNVYYGIDSTSNIDKPVATIGVFDGLHLGHRKIINELISKAKLEKTQSILITFEPHPRKVLNDGEKSSISILTTSDEKVELLRNTGLDAVVVIKTTKEFLNIDASEFIENILYKKIGIASMIAGYDYHFGKNREGNVKLLEEKGKKFGFDVQVVPPFKICDIVVNSSKIRELLLEGKVKKARLLLGRDYSLYGTVAKGSGRGRQLEFPTANIDLDSEDKLVPANGVYFIKVFIDDVLFFGICNIGNNPTFSDVSVKDNSIINIEVYILGFPQQDLYGCKIEIQFLERIRDEIKFETAEMLRKQMLIDKKVCLEKIKGYKVLDGG
jgi:riboflavin kinase/FMN adenylyltransferase